MKRFAILSVFLFVVPASFAQIFVSNSNINFFDQVVGGFGASSNAFVQNNGTVAVQVNVTNSCFGDFTVNNSCSFTLGPNQSCSIEVRFQPRQEGSQSCMITVSDSTGSSAFINVTGRGVRQP